MTTGSEVFGWIYPDWLNPATRPHEAISSVVGVGTLATAVVASWVGVRTLRETAKGVRNSYRPLMVAELMPLTSLNSPRCYGLPMTETLSPVMSKWPSIHPSQNPIWKGIKTESSAEHK